MIEMARIFRSAGAHQAEFWCCVSWSSMQVENSGFTAKSRCFHPDVETDGSSQGSERYMRVQFNRVR